MVIDFIKRKLDRPDASFIQAYPLVSSVSSADLVGSWLQLLLSCQVEHVTTECWTEVAKFTITEMSTYIEMR